MEDLFCWASKPFVDSSMVVLSCIFFSMYIVGFKKSVLIPLNLHVCPCNTPGVTDLVSIEVKA